MPQDDQATLRALLQGEEFNDLEEIVGMPEDRVVPALTAMLADEDPLIRQRAAIALGRIGSDRAAPALRERLHDPSVPVVLSAIRALGGGMEDAESASEISELLRSEDASIRGVAAEALGDMALPEAEEALTRLLSAEDEEFVRDKAAASLRRLLRRAAP
jgi:HEAT repeat protein